MTIKSPIVFSVAGNAVPKQSFRMGKYGGYQSKRVVRWETTVRQAAAAAMKRKRPIRSAVTVSLGFYLANISNSDLDNLSKGILDGIKGTVIADDVLVTRLIAVKYQADNFGNEPAVLVGIYPEFETKIKLPKCKNPDEVQKIRAKTAAKKQKKLAKAARQRAAKILDGG